VALNEGRYRDAERAVWESVGLRPSERLLELKRTGCAARVQETGDGPPIVFVHGTTNGGMSWSGLAAALPDFRCILLDRPGCGLSPAVVGKTNDIDAFGAYADDVLVDVLDALQLERADIVSTSYGGFFALHSVTAHRERFGRLFHFGWSFGAAIATLPLVMRLGGIPALARLTSRMPINERAVRSMLKRIGLRNAVETGRFTPEMVTAFTALMRDTPTMHNEVSSSPRLVTLRGLDERSLLPAALLANVTTPCHFMWGEDDPFGPPDIARAFVAQIPGAELELVPGGHAVWIDDVDRAAKAVRAFLSR